MNLSSVSDASLSVSVKKKAIISENNLKIIVIK